MVSVERCNTVRTGHDHHDGGAASGSVGVPVAAANGLEQPRGKMTVHTVTTGIVTHSQQ